MVILRYILWLILLYLLLRSRKKTPRVLPATEKPKKVSKTFAPLSVLDRSRVRAAAVTTKTPRQHMSDQNLVHSYSTSVPCPPLPNRFWFIDGQPKFLELLNWNQARNLNDRFRFVIRHIVWYSSFWHCSCFMWKRWTLPLPFMAIIAKNDPTCSEQVFFPQHSASCT